MWCSVRAPEERGEPSVEPPADDSTPLRQAPRISNRPYWRKSESNEKAVLNPRISIVANDKAEADRVFAALSTGGGTVNMPLANAPWGPYFGMCVDRFGVQWMVSLEKPV